MSQKRVIIVGGGVIGAACAHYLNKAGCDVTILERAGFGNACSRGNCGYICPSHVLPLAEPGAVRGTIKALLKRNSPFSIKPRIDFALWSWLWRFSRRCNKDDMMTAARAIQPLLESSLELYRELVASEPITCEWEERGLLFVYQTQQAFDAYARTNQLLDEEFGHGAKRLDSEELVAFEPSLKPGLAGGWFYEDDAHLRSDRLMESWLKLLTSRGVKVEQDAPVEELVFTNGAVTGVKTNYGEELTADEIVIATGAWTPLVRDLVGMKLPIQPGKGYSLTMPRPDVCPKTPMIFQEHRVAVTPFESGYRIGSTMEFAGYDASIREDRLKLLTEGASHYLQTPTADPVEETWFGWRPMTTDSLPFIGQAPVGKNVWVAAGHNMLGLSMATGTGKLICELLTDQTPHIDPHPYRIQR